MSPPVAGRRPVSKHALCFILQAESNALNEEGHLITRISLAFALLSCSAIWAADTVQPLNIKPGLWETTRTMKTSGQLLMPLEAREAKARMPPEQRAKAEEVMKEYANMAAKPTVHRDCLKKEDLDKPLIKLEDIGESCTRTILAASASKQEMRLQCTADGKAGAQNFSFRLDVIDSENFKSSMQGTASDGTGTMGMNSTVTAKWIGPVWDSKDQKR
ncbi:hypothetical protein SBA6_1110002 [Candidatus Sulfopaludibacter sp. SbA6]|nr:hypothetical protein SBA6_1110002 [Candidatus Sulfopaludibacter sp. SbA6]